MKSKPFFTFLVLAWCLLAAPHLIARLVRAVFPSPGKVVQIVAPNGDGHTAKVFYAVQYGPLRQEALFDEKGDLLSGYSCNGKWVIVLPGHFYLRAWFERRMREEFDFPVNLECELPLRKL